METGSIEVGVFRELEAAAGREFVAELVATYLEDAPTMLAALRSTLAAGDEEGFRRAAHSLKSNSLTFGAQALAAMARALETTAGDAVRRGDAGAVDPLDAELQRVAAELAKLVHG